MVDAKVQIQPIFVKLVTDEGFFVSLMITNLLSDFRNSKWQANMVDAKVYIQPILVKLGI